LASTADRAYLQALGAEGILYSRVVDSVSFEPLDRYWTYTEEEARPTLAHDVLSDAFLEKGATAYYCHEGHWLRFTTD
jgi:hypothetical protein